MKLNVKDFKLPEQLEAYKQAVSEFRKTELEKVALELDETSKIPARLMPMLSDAGLLRLRLPKQYGGFGLNLSQYWPIQAEVAKAHGTIRMLVHVHNGAWVMIADHGTQAQKKKYLPRWVDGTAGYPAFALTEPETGTGVDIKCTARKEGKVYKINGKKHLITGADIATFFHVVVYTGDRSLGAKGISMLIVDKGAPGLKIVPHKEMIGIRGCYHGIMIFEDCEVPQENLLGKEGEGLDIALRTFLDLSRIQIAISCVGPAERMLEIARDFAKQRVTFGKPIAERQAVQQMLADMATDIYATKCMIDDCAKKYDAGQKIATEASMCKLFGIEMVKRVSDLALLVHGGIGLTADYPLERHYRDCRAVLFEEGTPTIQRMVIGRDVLGKPVRQIGK